jgi:hypothetical protein
VAQQLLAPLDARRQVTYVEEHLLASERSSQRLGKLTRGQTGTPKAGT